MFDAFISYSQAADGKLAEALQKGLHRFAKPLFKMRAIRVFRDETTLAMTPKLWPEIEQALQKSRFFILMAEPLSARSEWVQKEVACWLNIKHVEKFLIVWTGGDLVWDNDKKDFDWDQTTALPRMLAGAFDGEEPLYLDMRWARSEGDLSRKHPKFANALARLSAAISGRSLDEIFGDDVREQRRTLQLLWTGITLLVLATLFAGWRWWGEFQAGREAVRQLGNVDWLLGVRARDNQKNVLRAGHFFFRGAKEFQSAGEESLAKNATLAGALASRAVVGGFLNDRAFEARCLTATRAGF